MSQSTSRNNTTVAQWVHDFGDYLFSWAAYKVRDESKAEDLVQDTFMAALKAIDTFEGKSSPKTWLTSILNRKIIDYYRKMANRPEQLLSDDSAAFQHTDDLFDKNDRWRTNGLEDKWEVEGHLIDNPDFNSVFYHCLNDLPKVWYATITAKYIFQKKPKEICQELGITPSNYWQVIHRAKLLLKKCLDTKWFEGQ